MPVLGALVFSIMISSKLHSLGIAPRTVVLPIAGLFFPERWPVLWEEFRMGVEVPVDGFMASWCHLLEGSFLHEGCVANATAAKRPVRECQDVSKILPLLKAEVFIFQNQFDQYQANHLGLCPPDLCNASTDVASRAGQYLQLFGRRSKETLQATIQTRPRLGVLAPSWLATARESAVGLSRSCSLLGWMASRSTFLPMPALVAPARRPPIEATPWSSELTLRCLLL